MDNIYPYDDDLMVYNKRRGRYELTEAAIIDCGINMRARLEANPSIDATFIINQTTRRVSELVYGYIHSFTTSTVRQDEIIATAPSAREIIFEALCQQLIYFLNKGDLSHSTDENARRLAIDASAKETLLRIIPEIGVSILYAGGY